VLQTLSATATADAALISAATGLDFGGFVSGPVGVDASMRTRRDGHDEITVRTELTQAALAVTALNFAKPAGQAATADVHLLLDHEQIAAIDVLRVQGEGMGVNGQIDFATGKPAVARLDRLVLGGATNLHGTVRWPTGPGGAWVIVAAGSSIDATAQLGRKKSKETKPPEEKRGPPWSIDATFDHVVAGPDRTLSKVVVKAQNDGLVTRQAQINGSTAPDGDFAFTILPHAGERTLTGQAADAGGLLRVLDVTPDMVGGHMRVSGRYDDAARQHPLAGTAEIDGFRMRKAPALAKLLQAMTLYGLVAVIEGPGLGFDHLVAPFRLSGDQLDLQDARAFNTSLGMTAKGRLDLAMGVCDVQGTIVPAYFFNSLLGSIPFVGKLFSPESGGGVLAASYTLRGDCDDPSVGVNPLAALTPGFLRGIFGLFDRNGTAAAPGAEHNGN